MANKVVLDRIERQSGRRLLFRCFYAIAVFLGVLLVTFLIYHYWTANQKPEVQQEAEILAAGGRPQRLSVAPTLSRILDSNLMPYGPIWEVTYAIDQSPLTVQKMKPLSELSGLQSLTILESRGSDPQSWQWLGRLSSLEEFTAIETDICDDDLESLKNLPRLRRVNLWHNSQLTSQGVTALFEARPDLRINFPEVPKGVGPKSERKRGMMRP